MTDYELEKIPLFSSLPSDEIKHLKETLTSVDFEPENLVIREGHKDNKFYILMEGQVEIIKSSGEEDERILGVRGAGTLLGEMSLFSREGCHTASVRSITPLRLLKVSHDELDALLHRQPQLAYEIIRLFSKRLEESENITIIDLREKNRRLHEAYDELKAAQEQIIEKEKLEKELEISGQIQQSILPESLPVKSGYEFGARMVPARQVGGDFYTFIDLPEDRIGLVVGDVSDKGVPAALFMALTYSLIRAEAVRTDSPIEALRNVNAQLMQMNASGMFVTLVYGILDCRSGNFHIARAGHPAPFVMDGDGKVIYVPVSPGQPLGIFDEMPIDEQRITIPGGGTLLLYSDGISETQDINKVDFGVDLLSKTVSSSRSLSAQQICEHLWQDVQAHGKGLPQQDDFTAVILKRIAVK